MKLLKNVFDVALKVYCFYIFQILAFDWYTFVEIPVLFRHPKRSVDFLSFLAHHATSVYIVLHFEALSNRLKSITNQIIIRLQKFVLTFNLNNIIELNHILITKYLALNYGEHLMNVTILGISFLRHHPIPASKYHHLEIYNREKYNQKLESCIGKLRYKFNSIYTKSFYQGIQF